MKHKIIYTLLMAFICMGSAKAQMECASTIEVTLNENGEGFIQASDLINDVEFFIANGTVTYFIMPFVTGVIESGDDVITVGCNSAWTNTFIVEYTQNGDLISSCSGDVVVYDPDDGCPTYTNFCENLSFDCVKATGSYSIQNANFSPIAAEKFAICSDELDCPGEYKIAIGNLADAPNLTYNTHLNSGDVDEYITPLVLSYESNGTIQYDNSKIYVWENLDCFLIPEPSQTISMGTTGLVTLTPDLFLKDENTCTQLSIAVTEINGDVPTQFFDHVELDCDDLGYHDVYLRDAETQMTVVSKLFLSDINEYCGPILGPGDKLISMANNPPLGTYANTTVSVNGVDLQVSLAGKGWIINEDMLLDGTNHISFNSGPFSLNGVSTMDLFRLLRIILNDEYDEPIQPIVMDIDNSGYNGIADLINLRHLILGAQVPIVPINTLFVPEGFEFPTDFSAFDFDYDFTEFEFEKSDFDANSFNFLAYKMGDFNQTAVTEDGAKTTEISSTRDVDVFEVSDMDVVAGVPFQFTLSYSGGHQFKGLLAALVSNGVKFESMTSLPTEDLEYNILNDNEIRISYITPGGATTIDMVSFEISAVADQSGPLIDMLGLKAGFPQEIINEDNEVIDIDDIEESGTTSVVDAENLETPLTIFPNPVSHILQIQSKDKPLGRIEVLNPMGKVMISTHTEQNKTQLDIAFLSKGMYYLSVEGYGEQKNRPFVKM